MSGECYPISTLPNISELYRGYLAMAESPADAPVRRWYGAEPLSRKMDGRRRWVEGRCCAAGGCAEDAERWSLARDLLRLRILRGCGWGAGGGYGAAGGVVWRAAADVVEGGYCGCSGEAGDARDGEGPCAGVLAGDGGP